LILALVFIVVVAVIVGAISSLTLNDLNNTTNFNQASAQSYSASSVANVAMRQFATPPSPRLRPSCIAVGTVLGTTPSELTFNLVLVEIWCETTVNKAAPSPVS